MIPCNGNSSSSGGGGNGSEGEERSSSQESQGAVAAAGNVGGESTEAAAAISCLELDAWIRDDDGAIDCMMMLPEVPLDGDSTSPEDSGMHAQDCCEQFEHKQHEDEMIFCRSSSSCSSTFPDSCANQETLELNIPDDFFGDRQQQHDEERQRQAEQQLLPPLTEARSGHQFAPDLRKIIVKKPVMDKAVERLGGGRRGAMRLWNIIQVWLKHQQQQGGGGSMDGFSLPFENFGGFMDVPVHNQQQQQQQHFQHPGFPVAGGFGGEATSTGGGGGGQFYGDPNVVPGQHFSSAYPDATTTAADVATPRSMATAPIANSASAAATTRAARKSRMARQRRHKGGFGGTSLSHSPVATSAGAWSSASTAGFLATTATAATITTTTTSNSSLSLATTHGAPGAREQHQHQFGTCRDGIKARMSCDKSVKFLLQKELKPSDVGNLGRIVLPKKEAEIHLPYLSLREGIMLAMEDVLTAQTWHFRYRFWPNNKSRMYLLEGTGDYVKSHLLKEGDLIQIYRDAKTGKHIICAKKFAARPVTPAAETTTTTTSSKLEDDCLSGASTVSDSSKDAPPVEQQRPGSRACVKKRKVTKPTVSVGAPVAANSGGGGVGGGVGGVGGGDEIERFPSIEMEDEFIDEILGMVDAEEPSSPESCKEDD
ncbi:hypothetical protein SELMODRAFT_431656 [Selaginella moellendorffii]|uniref:Uncharacterized protein ABI3A-2 n=1 Tax=Selaginella moellendorffii TaxID=88036 RepID=D8TDC9_SELML|nr:regulatory protein viviparous-1 [Selaginella moellendorffii]EFJ05287.1 hypothetical protein SELMODRAFT_431656 [Selaginella moellendorffii]|eukprot:XP_002993595.1 regulatory protein viviparous-1 [Selaginella moellendorffii]